MVLIYWNDLQGLYYTVLMQRHGMAPTNYQNNSKQGNKDGG